MQLNKDQDGYVFLDRNYEVFVQLLNHLRGVMVTQSRDLAEEAKFWNIPFQCEEQIEGARKVTQIQMLKLVYRLQKEQSTQKRLVVGLSFRGLDFSTLDIAYFRFAECDFTGCSFSGSQYGTPGSRNDGDYDFLRCNLNDVKFDKKPCGYLILRQCNIQDALLPGDLNSYKLILIDCQGIPKEFHQ